MRFQVGRIKRQVVQDEPQVEFIRTSANNWKALAPAIDPHYYPLEIVLNLSKSLPSDDVRITSYNQSARQISLGGEAKFGATAQYFVRGRFVGDDLE